MSRFPCTLLCSVLAAACTTSVQDINPEDDQPQAEATETALDTADSDPFLTDTGRPGAAFDSERYRITSLHLCADPGNAACSPTKADVDGDGTVENKVFDLLTAADSIFPGGFDPQTVDERIAILLESEEVVVLMSADNDIPVLEIGIALGERTLGGDLAPLPEALDPVTGQPRQLLTGTFTDADPAARVLSFRTEGNGAIGIPIQFAEDEPALTFTLQRARIEGAHRGARGSLPARLEGQLIGALRVEEVLEGAIYPLIDNFELWDEEDKKDFRDLARGLITNGADIDVQNGNPSTSDDPKISGVFNFVATQASW